MEKQTGMNFLENFTFLTLEGMIPMGFFKSITSLLKTASLIMINEKKLSHSNQKVTKGAIDIA